MDRIISFLKDNPTFYFATVDGDKPRVRPFGFCMLYRGRLYFGMGKHKASYQQLQQNPNVEITTASEDNRWIRIKGKAVFDESEDAQKNAFLDMPLLHSIYNEKTGFKLGLVYLEDIDAEIMDLNGNCEKLSV